MYKLSVVSNRSKKKSYTRTASVNYIIIISNNNIINMHKDARRRDVPCAGGAAA